MTSRHLFLAVVLATLVGGCSSTFRMPWEDSSLEVNRIATREPLEVPPDLYSLPQAGESPAAEESSKSSSARDHLFGKKEARGENARRSESGGLPGWMGSGGKNP
ncbi:MAG: hypothetical protein HQL56_11330 [Magnetococcales bacterium]|nr:hypothetical protein [Magnetococcales bacterium]